MTYSATSTSEQQAYTVQDFGFLYQILQYEAAYCVPWLTVLGLVSVCLVVACMPYTSVSVKLKMFYSLIALSTGLSLVLVQVFYFISSAAALYFSNGADYFYFPNESTAGCKIYQFLAYSSDGVTGFVALQLSIERLIVIYFPLRAYLLTSKRSFILCLSVLLTLAAINSFVFYTFDLYPSGYNSQYVCNNSPEMNALSIMGYLLNYVGPVTVLCLVTIALAVALKRRSLVTSALRSDNQFRARSKEAKATLTILLVSAARCSVYLPFAFLWTARYLTTDISEQIRLFCLGDYLVALSPLCALADFATYSALIPSFRSCVKDILRCRLMCGPSVLTSVRGATGNSASRD
jgi:hypothetical protein